MSNQTLPITPELHAYLVEAGVVEPEILRRLRDETAQHPKHNMQIAPEQGRFMQLLATLGGARRTLEVGVFTGYSSLAVALALPADGRIVACDVSDEYTAIARRYWAEAGVAEKIDLRIAPALETLDALIAEGAAETFDFAFVDADKENSDNYYERVLTLLRPGGLFLNDNALSDGEVVNPPADRADIRALDALNRKVTRDPRVVSALVPIADGLLMAVKRG